MLLLFLARKLQPDTGDHVLAHPIRRTMLGAVTAQPGLAMGELRKVVRLGWGNGYHHLRKLERAGLVRRARLGRRLVIYPTSAQVDHVEAKARAYLKAKAAAMVCMDILWHPGTDVGGVARRTGLTMRSVYYHVKLLSGLGLVASRSQSRQFALYALPLCKAIWSSPS